MKSRDMIRLIKEVDQSQFGAQKMQAARVLYFQKTSKFDSITVGCEYDSNFDGFVNEMEQAIGGTIYRPTAKKILNNWYLWALEQRKRLSANS